MTAVIQTNIFDYAALDSETRIVVQQRTTEIKALMKRAASDIIEIGQKLIEVKARLPRGSFDAWSKAEIGMERATAYRFMQVAGTFGKSYQIDTIAPSALYLIASPSTPEETRAELIGRAEQGEAITYSAARDLIEEAQEARRYDGFANIPAPDDLDDEPLSEYEQGIADAYSPPAMSQPMSILTSQGTVEWYTPPDLIERARMVLGAIDLDPASSETAQQWIRATDYYTIETSQLPWVGRVWLNPPFDDTPTWVDRLDSEYIHGDVTSAVLLVNSAPGYVWWENLWRRRPVCMLRERVCFIRSDGVQGDAAKKGTTIAYYGDDLQSFIAQFSSLGRIILPND
jgi:DNA N-6-adenine-methyltransferase (Dam)/Protein of unknown function (DUF3102)